MKDTLTGHTFTPSLLQPLHWAVIFLVLGGWISGAQAQPPTDPTPTPSSATTMPAEGDFDIELDTSEFEDFGEDAFRLEEEISPAAEASITATKIILALLGVAAVVFLVYRLMRRKST